MIVTIELFLISLILTKFLFNIPLNDVMTALH